MKRFFTALLLGALFLVLLFLALRYWSNHTLYGQIDGCLDRGGRWDHAVATCEGARPLP